MPEKEPQIFVREGHEKWAKEFPQETFGAEEDRRRNFERLMGELNEEKNERGITENEYKGRLSKAERFLEDMPLVHGTSLKTAAEIFRYGELASVSKLKETGRRVEFVSGTSLADRGAGLDRFIFFSNGIYGACGEVYLVFHNNLLKRPDCLVTAEDIAVIPDRLEDCEGEKHWRNFHIEKEKKSQLWQECLKEYKQQVLSGRDFRSFLANFIATRYANPEDYLALRDGFREKQANFRVAWSLDNPGRRIPLYQEAWHNPEIKISNRIPINELLFVMVMEQEEADLLRKRGVPSNKIVDQTYLNLTGRGLGPFLRIRS